MKCQRKYFFLNIKYGPIQLIIQFFELSAIKKNLLYNFPLRTLSIKKIHSPEERNRVGYSKQFLKCDTHSRKIGTGLFLSSFWQLRVNVSVG